MGGCASSPAEGTGTNAAVTQPNTANGRGNGSQSSATGQTRGGGGGGGGEPTILTTAERLEHDQQLREHLLVQMTPNKVQLTVAAAAMFVARSVLAKKVVAQRKDESEVAAIPLRSPSKEGKEEEAMRSRMSREEKIEDGLKLLRERVDNIKVKVIHMEDDGNCQFRSLSAELFGSQNHHGLVRSKVVEYMASHADEYSFYIGEAAEWANYLRTMAKPRTWGDELTLRAACDCFGCVVHVVTTEHDNWLLHYVPSALDGQMREQDSTPPEGVRECFLAYVSPIHYNIIAPLEDARQASKSGY